MSEEARRETGDAWERYIGYLAETSRDVRAVRRSRQYGRLFRLLAREGWSLEPAAEELEQAARAVGKVRLELRRAAERGSARTQSDLGESHHPQLRDRERTLFEADFRLELASSFLALAGEVLRKGRSALPPEALPATDDRGDSHAR